MRKQHKIQLLHSQRTLYYKLIKIYRKWQHLSQTEFMFRCGSHRIQLFQHTVLKYANFLLWKYANFSFWYFHKRWYVPLKGFLSSNLLLFPTSRVVDGNHQFKAVLTFIHKFSVIIKRISHVSSETKKYNITISEVAFVWMVLFIQNHDITLLQLLWDKGTHDIKIGYDNILI